MRFQLETYAKDTPVANDTVHNTILNAKGTPNSRDIYKDHITWTLVNNAPTKEDKKKAKKPWPRNWMTLSVTDLAPQLLALMLFLFITIASQAQLQLSLGTMKTDTRNRAITLGIAWATNLDSLFQNSNFFSAGKRSSFSIHPSINMQTGTNDAFSSIEAKATGLLTTFKTTTVSGIVTPNTRRTFNTFPFSVGIESDNTFGFINGIVEAGWVPWYQSEPRDIPDFIKRTRFGVYLQGGYKFYSDSTGDKKIARAKGSFSIDTKRIITIQGLGIGLVGSADGWYDFFQRRTYHKIIGAARVFLSDVNFVDFEYQNGAGAPNFRQGEQYGLNLKIIF